MIVTHILRDIKATLLVVGSGLDTAPLIASISIDTLERQRYSRQIGVLKKGLSSMDILALIIAVVLILYLMQVGFPRSARQLSASHSFLGFYFRRIFSSWVLLSIAGILLLHDGIPLSRIGLLLPDPWWPTLLAFIGVGLLFCSLLRMHLRLKNDEQLGAKLAREKLRLALPRTSSERLVWVAVSINAGIWEEIVFRGFLPWYVVQHVTLFGFSVPFVWAAIFSLMLFSLAHLYQGWGGVLGVGFVGITLVLLYALTGNVLASMLWHMLFDVRFSFRAPAMEGKTQLPAKATEVRPNSAEGDEPMLVLQ
ncbi:MAG TPA: CPBP family intramembrane glutamic endopeptidase [Ktedonobacteraceae bacterium]|nr:CPBP family intramembrane glutamic endopeptidase [Ktedonobacteraceae bacterium]